MNDAQLGLAVVAIVAICQAIKAAGINSRWIPLIAIILGIGSAFFYGGVNFLTSFAGIIVGLTASGGFSFVKKTVLGK